MLARSHASAAAARQPGVRPDEHDAVEGGVADLDRAVGVEHALRALDAPSLRLAACKHEARR